jgi:hypothetical protein
MLYVHRLMGDGRAGEVTPAALGPAAVALDRRLARTARRYHGPYRIEAHLSAALTVGRPAAATIRVLSAGGNALPGVGLTISADGAGTVSQHVRTDVSGCVAIALMPTAVGVRLRVATEPLPSNRTRIFVPTRGAAAGNGQRLAAPSSQRTSVAVSGRAQPVVVASVSSRVVRAGSPIFDRVRVEGLGDLPGRVDVELFGPFAARRDIRLLSAPWAISHELSVSDLTHLSSPESGYYRRCSVVLTVGLEPRSVLNGCSTAATRGAVLGA